jgi:hypothetical protein
MSNHLNRREFLATSTLAGAALAVRPLTAETQAASVRIEDRMTPILATK